MLRQCGCHTTEPHPEVPRLHARIRECEYGSTEECESTEGVAAVTPEMPPSLSEIQLTVSHSGYVTREVPEGKFLKVTAPLIANKEINFEPVTLLEAPKYGAISTETHMEC